MNGCGGCGDITDWAALQLFVSQLVQSEDLRTREVAMQTSLKGVAAYCSSNKSVSITRSSYNRLL